MQRRPAKVLEPDDVRLVLKHVQRQRHPERNRVIILLSFKAGLRAGEIAGLEWPMVLGSDKRVSQHLTIASSIAKKGSGRIIPMHRQLGDALRRLHKVDKHPCIGPVVQSERAGKMRAGSVVNWFASVYRELDLIGCSSHSGRRTFITTSARVLAKTGGSLRDIQELAGHRAITTTERYIQGNRDAQRRLISLI